MYERFSELFGYIPDLLWVGILVALAIVAGFILKFLLGLVLRYFAGKEAEYSLSRSIFRRLSKPMNWFLPVFMLSLLLPAMRVHPDTLEVLEKVIQIVIIILITAILIGVTGILEDYIYSKYDISKADNFQARKIRTQVQFIRKFLITVLMFVCAAVILLSFDSMRRIGTGLLTGVGIGGIIIGFAAQKSLGNLLAGFQVAFTQPIRIDDVLVVEGEWGRVEEITLTYVVLKIWDQRRLILPITYFIEKPFQNWTRSAADILGTVFFYLDYTVPTEKLREELTRLLETNPLWDRKVNALQVTDTKEQTIEVRALLSARNSGDAYELRCYVREQMIRYIRENYPDSLPTLRLHTDAPAGSKQ